MNEAEKQAVSENGYALINKAVSPATVNALLVALSHLPAAHAHRNLLNLPAIHSFAHSPEALQWITPILGPNAFPVRGILFDKIPDANWKVTWHQDLSIAVKARSEVPGYGPWSLKDEVPHVQPPQEILENMLTLRLHLDDCLTDNGPVRVLPKSHAHGILKPEAIQKIRREIPEVSAELLLAGVLLMRPLLLHASSPAANPNHRRVVHIEYANCKLPAPLQWHAA